MKKLSKFLSKVTKFIRATIKFVAIQVVILVIGFMPYILSETLLEYRFYKVKQTHFVIGNKQRYFAVPIPETILAAKDCNKFRESGHALQKQA
jgi:hypothetical protein